MRKRISPRAHAIYSRRYRDSHKGMGLCRDCKNVAEPGKSMCKEHLEKMKKRTYGKRTSIDSACKDIE